MSRLDNSFVLTQQPHYERLFQTKTLFYQVVLLYVLHGVWTWGMQNLLVPFSVVYIWRTYVRHVHLESIERLCTSCTSGEHRDVMYVMYIQKTQGLGNRIPRHRKDSILPLQFRIVHFLFCLLMFNLTANEYLFLLKEMILLPVLF